MKDDKNLIAAIFGVIATIPCEMVTQMFVYLGLASHSEFNQSSMLVTVNRPTIVIGVFVSSVVAALISILLYQAFMRLGSQHIIIKCVGVSIFMWMVLEFIFTIYFEGKLIPVRPVSGYYSHLIGAFAFGITQGILFKRYLFHKHIKDEPIESTNIEAKPIEDKDIKTQHIDDEEMGEQTVDDEKRDEQHVDDDDMDKQLVDDDDMDKQLVDDDNMDERHAEDENMNEQPVDDENMDEQHVDDKNMDDKPIYDLNKLFK